MEALWRESPAAPGDVLAALDASGSPRLAYTTITTILVRLADKGYLERHRDGRRFLYRPLVGPEDLEVTAGRRAFDRLLRRYGPGNVARFAADLVDLDPELRERLNALANVDELDAQ